MACDRDTPMTGHENGSNWGCSSVDVLVNNAGEIPSGPIESLSEEDWRRGYDLKLFGYITLTRELYKVMKARGEGVIINDIGNSGENWDANYIAGSTANAALMAFTKAWAARASISAYAGRREPDLSRPNAWSRSTSAAR
jgi:NAD(P)-dependent dehydrogenase (short-subunit alcohol dehydrogenase family)